MKAKTYKITRCGKTYRSRGEDAIGALWNLAMRKLPNGDYWWFDVRVKLVDADTRGRKWATAIVDGAYAEAEVA
ncbi:MAG: hypothetical protein J6Q22_09410 [Prevotella sp.]|nr:hypothetical protein [Prevotella sp.]